MMGSAQKRKWRLYEIKKKLDLSKKIYKAWGNSTKKTEPNGNE